MIKTKTKLFLVLFILITLISTAVFATEPTNDAGEPVVTSETTDDENNQQTISEEDIEQKDRYFAGDNIEINTLIAGNVFAIGKNVTLTGQISGDLFVIAETLTISSGTSIYGSTFAIASEINVDGEMYELYATCDKLTIDYYGRVYRDLSVIGTEVSINGIVDRNAYLDIDKLKLEKDCILRENLNYKAQSEAIYIDEEGNESTTIPETVVVGEKNYTQRNKKILKKEIKKSVNSILKSNKINGDVSEDKIKSIITSYIFNIANVSTNSEILKDTTNKVLIPTMYIYLDIIVIIALVLGIVLPKVIGKKEKTEKESKKSKEE